MESKQLISMYTTLLYKKTVYNGHTVLSSTFSAGFMDSRTRSISQAKNRAKAVIMLSDMVTFITLTFADEDIRHSFYQCYMYTKRFLAALKKIFPNLEYSCGFHCSNHFHAHIITNIPMWCFGEYTSMLDNSMSKLDVSTFMNSPVYGDTLIESITDDEQYFSRENLCKYLLKDFWYLYGIEYDNAKSYPEYTKIKPFIHSSGMKTIKDVKTSLYMLVEETGENICVSGYDSKPHPTGSEDIIIDDDEDGYDVVNMFCDDEDEEYREPSAEVIEFRKRMDEEHAFYMSFISTADTDISEKGSDISVLKRNITFFKALKPLKKLNFFKKRDIYINNYNRELLYFKRFFFFSRGKKQFGIRPPPRRYFYTHAP